MAGKKPENIKSTSPADYKGTDKDVDNSTPDPDKGSQQPLPDQPQQQQPEFMKAPDPAPPPQTPAPEHVPNDAAAAKEKAAGESAKTPAGSPKITIEGEGQCVIHVDGAVQYLERGKSIKVDDATLAALDAAAVPYKKGK